MPIEVQAKTQVLAPAETRVHTLATGSERLTLMEVWRVLMKRRFVVLAVMLLSLAGAFWYALRWPLVFESVARIEIRPQEMPKVGVQQFIEDQQEQPERDLKTEMEVLQSDSVLFQTAQSVNLLDPLRKEAAANARKKGLPTPPLTGPITPVERHAMIQFIRDGLNAKVITGTNVVEIRYRNEDPRLAAAIVNHMVDTYSDEGLRTNFERTVHVSSWLQQQLDGLKTEASDAQQQLANYQKAHNIVGTDENSNLTIQTLKDISLSLDDAEADRIMKEARMHDFDSLGSNLVPLMGDNPSLTALRAKLADLQTQRAQLAVKYGPKFPRVIETQMQIDKVQAQIDGEVALAKRQVQGEYQDALGTEQALRQRLNAQEEATYKLNEGAAQYAILRNQAELTRDLYDILQLRLKEATVMAGLAAAKITVVDSGQVPYLPVAPRKRLSVLMGFLGGLLGGWALAFLVESIDDRLQTSDEVEAVSMLPSLAAVPHFTSDTEKRRRRELKDPGADEFRLSQQLVALRDSKSVCAEAYRNLRSSLLLSSIDNPPRIIVVTSAFPEEGKTATAINCAIVLAQRGERVLLVDADLRRGSLGAVFGVSSRTMGLSAMLANPEVHRDIPAPLPELPTLHVLATGPRPPNPAETLSSARMAEQLRRWAQEYDRIVFDTAPLLSVSDSQALVVFADTVVLITRAGMTRRRALIRARDLLLRINAPIAGVVVNDVDVRLEHFYTYRYGMYGYSYGYGSRYSDRAYGYDKKDEEAQ